MPSYLRTTLICFAIGVAAGVVAYFLGISPLVAGIVVVVGSFVFFMLQARARGEFSRGSGPRR
jgi:Flp pilus assembly protein TadB